MGTQAALRADDARVASPFLTTRDVAGLLEMNRSKTYAWAHRGLVTTVEPHKRGWPTVPLLGLVEYETFRGMRAAKLPMAEVVAIANFVRREFDNYGFLSKQIAHDGTVAYFESDDNLERVTNGQLAFWPVVEDYLRPLVWDLNDWAYRYRVEAIPGVVIDPEFNAGRMMFERNSVPVFAVAGLLKAGEPAAVVMHEYGLTDAEVASVEAKLPWLSEVA